LEFSSEELRDDHRCDAFDSGNPALDGWLRGHALHAAGMNTGRTFVWHSGDREVRAYFTLAAHLMERATLPPRVGRGSPAMIPAVLLARLALDRGLQGQGLGAELLWDALSRGVAANRQAAARLVVVDAFDDGAASFYAHHGFLPVDNNPRRLVQKLSSIESALDDRPPAQ